MLTPAYVAGLLDGEGCLTVSRRLRRSKRSFQPTVVIQMAHEDLILELQSQYGGTLARKQQKSHWAVQWSWTLGGEKSIRALLEEVLPFLVVKRRQAEILLEYFGARSQMGLTRHRTEEERDQLEEMCVKIQHENRKGYRGD
jgi:hypothetical protein